MVKRNLRRIMSVLIIIVLTFAITACSGKEEEKEAEKAEEAEEAEEVYSLSGMYKGEGRDYSLYIYEDGTLVLSKKTEDKTGTYEELSDNEWFFTMDSMVDLKGSLTKDGNLYVTSESTNWDTEVFRRIKPSADKIDLGEATGNNWEEFEATIPEQELDGLVVKRWDEGDSYDAWTYNIFDKVAAVVVVNGYPAHVYISDLESTYCVYGVSVGEKYDEALITKQGFTCTEEDEFKGEDLGYHVDHHDDDVMTHYYSKENQSLQVTVITESNEVLDVNYVDWDIMEMVD